MPGDRRFAPTRQQLAAAIAVRLRELRARFDLTQDEIARRVGCHESALSRWENGSRIPSLRDLIALAQVYRVSCDTLLGLDEVALPRGSALLDQALLDRLGAAGSDAGFDEIVQQRREHAVWVPVEDGAVVVPLAEAVRRANETADRFPGSVYSGLLFRPSRREK